MANTARKLARTDTAPAEPAAQSLSVVNPTRRRGAPRSGGAPAPKLSLVGSNAGIVGESDARGLCYLAFQQSNRNTFLCDRDFIVIYANASCRRAVELMTPALLGFNGFEGFTTDKFVGWRLEAWFGEALDEFRKLRDPRNLPYVGLISLGPLVFEFNISELIDERGEHIGYVVSAADMTEQAKSDADYKRCVHEISDVIDRLRAASEGDLTKAMQALAAGNLSYAMNPSTHAMEVPEQPDLALMANRVNELRSAIIGFEEAYNSARESTLLAVARQVYGASLLSHAMEELASGNLTAVIDVEAESRKTSATDLDAEIIEDIFGGMRAQTFRSVNAYNSARNSLSDLVARTKVASDSIAQASGEIASGTDDLAQRTEEQASSLEETASSMEEMTSTVKQNADNARQANQLAAQAREVAEKGGSVVGNAVRSMEEINTASKRIADIISVIDEIAFQTNLLALNAAVEAARVGEQGRGFAVVAAEVRNLAGRSATAAKEIKALVQDSVQKVQEGSNQVNQSGQTLDEIVLAVKKVADIISEISAASQEQSAGIEQVNKAVMQMDQITQQNAALVEETAAASQSMTQQTSSLRELVGRFQVEASLIASAESEAKAALASQSSGGPAASRPSSRATVSAKIAPRKRVAEPKTDDDGFEEF
jgi:methyl-accepting chemotaxis protein